MPFDSWDDAMFWHGSLIGYMAGVKAACKDKKKSDLLLEMSEVQSKLEIEELKNAKLRELCADMWATCCGECELCEHSEEYGTCEFYRRMRELGVDVP